jgi:hypothetical protein
MSPNSVPERPADPMTSQDGARLYAMVENYFKEINNQIKGLSGMIASLQRQQIESLSLLNIIESGLSQSRVNRLEIEVREAELERERAEKNLEVMKERLHIKQEVKDKSVSTNERIQAVTASTVADLEQKRRESSAAFRVDLGRSMVKAVLTALAVSGTFGTLAFIWWLIQLYVNQGGP